LCDKQIDIFLNCLNKKEFYDAHEALETIWFDRRFENNNEIKLLKGFINAAVCFELIKRGRKEQSKRVWSNYLKYRQLLYKINSPYIVRYHQVAREIESLYKKLK
jgi:hypothetical protein